MYPSGPRYVTPILQDRKVIKAVSRKNYRTAAKSILAHPQLSKFVTSELAQGFRTELKKVTANGSTSVVNRTDVATVRSFSWEMLRDDLTQHCSLLHKFLQLCVPQKKRECAGGVLSLFIAMLAKMTNQRSRLVQTVLSLILLAGHATKQVSMIDVCILHVYVVAHDDSIHLAS